MPTDHPETLRIGLFGGTFDPVHTGHLVIAEHLFEYAQLDSVVFIPASKPPHKHYKQMFTARQRFDMLTAAVSGNPHFTVSDIELKRQGTSFTIDTVYEMKQQYPIGTELFFIVGKDNLYEIDQWKNPQDIVQQCTLLVADRECLKSRDLPDWLAGKVQRIQSPLIQISSTDIRNRIIEKRSIRYLVPDAVQDIIMNIENGR